MLFVDYRFSLEIESISFRFLCGSYKKRIGFFCLPESRADEGEFLRLKVVLFCSCSLLDSPNWILYQLGRNIIVTFHKTKKFSYLY
ncbi:hypothetical protein DQM68_18490 [Leptospira mayottensis]|uniref:Uncharacterized protein n=2 Tax=Leptospira mayottensis TaxID=1137606 RepID=A0AA87SWH5_9LEPT|nr:hypothetical protein DQM68_18490 [Leptospira mayottensis]AZQ04054.1 hypothetical protein LEP1GSC190_18565 [Leptospira mayottensis 200901116]EKS00079.1 hypothetical protein LEP1GSC125_3548 [Leptospira mayottensis 200901122]AXR66434.1 hypothetical protein DQM28_19735 [Leptospira mayottensis]AXR69985.1 hypothetical protein DPV73_18405 [Leptospira mayottensis]